MKVLLIGSGGREHALAYKLRSSKKLSTLHVIPGNGGFPLNEILPGNSFNLKDKDSVIEFVIKNNYDLVVIGPEEPLVTGIADWIGTAGIPVFGPSAYCAQIEGSKEFAKIIMKEMKIPTASYESFENYESALAYIEKHSEPLVVKADGLAFGKGVTVAETRREARIAIQEIFQENKFGNAGKRVVIEEFMEGEEASIFAITDGENFAMFPAAQDHKRAFDGDKGPNTGGMGAYAPAPIATQMVYEQAKKEIFEPLLLGFRKRGFPYRGLLYAGLMIGKDHNARVVEFNCRFGDPETQCLMLLLEDDLLELMYESATGNLTGTNLKLKSGYSSTVVLAAIGYPDSYQKGIELNLKPPENDTLKVFHSGTKSENGKIISTGGRILSVSSFAPSLEESVSLSYKYLLSNPVQGTFYRKDIAHRAIIKK